MAVNSKQQATNPVVLNPIDVINLDLMTHEVNGFGVVQQLRAHSKAKDIPSKLEGHVQANASKSGSGKEDLLRALERLVKRKFGE